jgi:phosphoribosylanthranilate isomerase
MTVRVKICGIKTVDIAMSVIDSGGDFIGINFSPVSKRSVDLKKGVEIFESVKKRSNHSLLVVGLFYQNSELEITEILSKIPFDFVQFVAHDNSLNLKLLQSFNRKLIAQVSVKKPVDDSNLAEYDSEFLILDSYKEGLGGGSGQVFEWENAKAVRRKYLLAGGLNPSNVSKAIEVLHPFGVDVASGVESSPGVKDIKLIKEFIKNAKRI